MRVCARARVYIDIRTSMERLGDRPRYRVMYVCVFVFVEMVASRRVLVYIHADMSVATILVYMQGEGRESDPRLPASATMAADHVVRCICIDGCIQT